VLCVDDDPQIRSALIRSLRGEPYELLVADGGSRALDILAAKTVRETEPFSMQPLDVNPVIEKELAFFNMIPDFKYKIEKELLLDKTIPRIRGNPIQIKQILDKGSNHDTTRHPDGGR
jgi:CheY-like chemotaxis protein